jgi:hypothetical protein
MTFTTFPHFDQNPKFIGLQLDQNRSKLLIVAHIFIVLRRFGESFSVKRSTGAVSGGSAAFPWSGQAFIFALSLSFNRLPVPNHESGWFFAALFFLFTASRPGSPRVAGSPGVDCRDICGGRLFGTEWPAYL